MSDCYKRTLFWSPPALSIVFIAFINLFALDVFEEQLTLLQTIKALTIHLIPLFVLIAAALLLAWRWEWIGAAAYAVSGVLYFAAVICTAHPVVRPMRLIWALTIAGPALVIATLFFANWLKHDQLRSLRR